MTDKVWEPAGVVVLNLADVDHYKTDSDPIEFDCACADTTDPNYENLPFDFVLWSLENRHFTCPRCGRQYRVNLEISVEVYVPLEIRYPNVKNRDPGTLGLRESEND